MIKLQERNKNEENDTNNLMQNNQILESMVEITKITEDGFWIRVFVKEYFRRKKLGKKPKDYFVSFEFHPHFFGATEEEIRQVRVDDWYCCLHWDMLETGFELCNIGKPKSGRYYGFSKKHLERLKKYNDEQIAKGKKPWLNDRLNDFPYWREINEN